MNTIVAKRGHIALKGRIGRGLIQQGADAVEAQKRNKSVVQEGHKLIRQTYFKSLCCVHDMDIICELQIFVS
jgi:hypothetical protein